MSQDMQNGLNLIIGKPSDDISGTIFDRLISAAKNGGRVMLIVPDQAEFETERRLYLRCKEENSTVLFANMVITTISKLCDDILEQYAKGKLPADDITKQILMSRAVKECEGSLEAFSKIASRPGFAGRMIGTISMLKSAGYTTPKLFEDTRSSASEKLGEESRMLASKMNDISLIYTHYDALLVRNYSDRLDSTARAAQLAEKHGYFCGTNVFMKDFDTFSPNQRAFIKTMIATADSVTMAYISSQDDSREMFRPITDEMNGFISACDGNAAVSSCPPREDYDAAISEIGKRIFSDEKPTTVTDSSNAVTVIRADDANSELDYAAAEIKRLCTEEGYSYNQIALLTPSPAEYKTSIESTFEKYGIPYFCDIPDSMQYMPLTNLVLSLLNVLQKFTVENLLSFIKTGFARVDGKLLSDNDINHFEEFIYKWKLRPEDLRQPFPESDSRYDRTDNAERIRKGIVGELLSLRDSIKGKNGAEMTKAICEYLLDNLDLAKSLSRQYMHIQHTDESVKKQLIDSYQMQWNVLKQIFESLYTNLEDYSPDLGEYYQLFRDICISTPLAKPPQVIDAVIAGDISRTKAYDIRAVFIVGAGFETFPTEDKRGGIFSEHEIELLIEKAHIPLGMSSSDRYYYSQYQAYRALTLPTERLYLCYPMVDISGIAASPSTVVHDICSYFDGKSEQSTADFDDIFYCRSVKAAQQRYATLYRSGSHNKSDLRLALSLINDESSFAGKLDKVAENRGSGYGHTLSADTAELIFRHNSIPATRMESLNKCRFRYFCEYGLRIKDSIQKEINPIEIGNAVHHSLRKIMENSFSSAEAKEQFITSTDEKLEKLAKDALDEYKQTGMMGEFGKSKRFNYLYDNLSIAVVDMLKIFRREFVHSNYTPKFFELDINLDDAGKVISNVTVKPLPVTLDNGRTVYITGQVDRADILTDKSGSYLRVVDYKTGEKKLFGEEIRYGQNTQMLNYLMALCEPNSDLIPGGISYIPSGVESAKKAELGSSLPARLAVRHAPRGIYVRYGDSNPVESDLDSYIEGMASDFFVERPDKLIDKSKSVVSQEKFDELKNDCMHSNKQALESLFGGDINAIPFVLNNNAPCDYCTFGDICANRGCEYDSFKADYFSPEPTPAPDAAPAAADNTEASTNNTDTAKEDN